MKIHKSEIIKAFKENRLGKITENYVTEEGEEIKIVAAMFVRGTLGFWVADAYRLDARGDAVDGPTPVPVRLSEVSRMDEEELWDMIAGIFSKELA